MPKVLELLKMAVTVLLTLLVLYLTFILVLGVLFASGGALAMLGVAAAVGGFYATAVLLMWKRPLLRRIYFAPLIACGLGVAVLVLGHVRTVEEPNAPVMAERTGSLYDYEPFVEGSRIARLEGPASFGIEGDPPRMDSATALYPVAAAFVEAVYPPDGDYSLRSMRTPLTGTGTESAYIRLIYGDADVILTAGPSADQLREAEAQGVELQLIPIGREAFVFFTHRDNPVENLTLDQIRDIYSGAVTNWREVGGEDLAIRAFQRNPGSGSQTALEALMGDHPLMTPPGNAMSTGMGEIIEGVADYRNFPGAIGYSFRYYTEEMVASDEIKLLSVEGVEPTRESIRSGLYPITSNFYAVVRDEAHSETLDALLDWMRSDEGQYLVEATGYVPVK